MVNWPEVDEALTFPDKAVDWVNADGAEIGSCNEFDGAVIGFEAALAFGGMEGQRGEESAKRLSG